MSKGTDQFPATAIGRLARELTYHVTIGRDAAVALNGDSLFIVSPLASIHQQAEQLANLRGQFRVVTTGKLTEITEVYS